MKIKLLLPCLCIAFISATGPWYLSPKQIAKDYVKVKAGTVDGIAVKEFRISAIEVSNKQYRDFLVDLRNKGDWGGLKVAMVDTIQWDTYMTYNDPFTHQYFQNSRYDNYPVVNITAKGAQLYCRWLTDKYNALSKRKVEFRLPSEAEWMVAAKGGNPKAVYPWKGDSIKYQVKGKWFGEDLCNYTRAGALSLTINKDTKDVDITAPCRSYMTNDYGIFNMSGNVAELVQETGYTKGGGWASKAPKVKIDSREDFRPKSGTSPNVGFRPVMVEK